MIKSFKLGGLKYTVEQVSTIDDSCLGVYYSASKHIKVTTQLNGRIIPEDAQEQTLYHEVVHAILDELGRADLSEDENFVQSFSLMIHQFETSKQ